MMDCFSNFVDSLKCMIWFVFCHYYGLGITGDGRCLFRSVAHGAYLRSGKPSPSEHLQKQLADELRSKVNSLPCAVLANSRIPP